MIWIAVIFFIICSLIYISIDEKIIDNKEIDLDKLAEIRKNIQKEYSKKNIENYTLKAFEKELKKFKFMHAKEFFEAYSRLNSGYKWYSIINAKEIKSHFLGLNDLELLNAINNQNFKDNLEEIFKDVIGRKALSELAEKTIIDFEDFDLKKFYIKDRQNQRSFYENDEMLLSVDFYIKFKY